MTELGSIDEDKWSLSFADRKSSIGGSSATYSITPLDFEDEVEESENENIVAEKSENVEIEEDNVDKN